jgi:hypothetical protein
MRKDDGGRDLLSGINLNLFPSTHEQSNNMDIWDKVHFVF